MAIYNDIATVIGNGGYDLVDLLHRIDVIYVSGQLTDVLGEAGVARQASDRTAPARGPFS